jgi:hypothetical protein
MHATKGCIRSRINGLGLLLLLAVVWVTGCSSHPQVSPRATYLSRLSEGIQHSRAQLPAMTKSAQEAAHRVVAGGQLWIGGSQQEFGQEAVERAGGLMGINRASGSVVKPGDVVLIGARGNLTPEDLESVRKWRDAGAEVVAFASNGSNIAVGDQIIPLDTVLNLIDLWTWTGEFTAACTRLGKMPVFFKSYHLADGVEWAHRNRGQMFHSDIKVSPIAPGVLGAQYLDQIQQIIDGIKSESSHIRQAAQWLRAAQSNNPDLYVMAHIYPQHFQDPRTPQEFRCTPGPTRQQENQVH